MPVMECVLPEPPEGFEYTGEIRVPKKGEYALLAHNGKSSYHITPCDGAVSISPILKRKRWAPALGEVYWYVDMEVLSVKQDMLTKTADITEQLRIARGNAFKGRIQAETLCENLESFLRKAIEEVK